MDKHKKLIEFVENNVEIDDAIYLKVDVEDPLMDDIMQFGAESIREWLTALVEEWNEHYYTPVPKLIRLKLAEMEAPE